MANISEYVNKDGSVRYKVSIRKNGFDIFKSFRNLEDAEIYASYKEDLIDCMKNFDVPLKDRLTLEQVLCMKMKTVNVSDKRYLSEFESSIKRLDELIGKNTFINSITYDQWMEMAKKLLSSYVYRGGKTEKSKRLMSPATLKRIFAHVSSAINYCQTRGFDIPNHPLSIIRGFINPMIDSQNIEE